MKNTLSFIKSTKLVIIFLVIATMLMPLTSCGVKTEEAEDDSFMKKYETPEKLEPVTVKIMFPGVQPQNWPLVKEEIEKRSSEELNATIEFKWMDRNEYIDMSEFTRRIEEGIYDKDEFDKALKWAKE